MGKNNRRGFQGIWGDPVNMKGEVMSVEDGRYTWPSSLGLEWLALVLGAESGTSPGTHTLGKIP